MTRTINSTPAADGYRMPAEFEPHEGCLVGWPERPDNWRRNGRPAQSAFAEVAAAIAVSEPVTVCLADGQFDNARGVLASDVRIVEMTSDDAWMRDVGPTFVTDGRGGRRGIDWRFNAWGGLYSPYDRDERVARKVLELCDADRYRAPLVLEGGSIHVDGEGTLLTTEQCLLNENRNPSLSQQEIEQLLREYTGAELVIWLGEGVVNDETDGHIDNLACFASPGVVALNWCEDENDPQHEVAADAERRLLAARDAQGRKLEVVRVPCPPPMTISDAEARGVYEVLGTHPRRAGDRMAASYVNFFIGNSRVVFPLLDESTDEQAREILAGLFPQREVVGIPSREILLGGGNIHCITQQLPAVER